MALTKIEFKPGINRESTSYAEEGSWYDCDKIRFRAGRPETIGGWITPTSNVFKGVCRMMVNWTIFDGTDCLGMGTNKKFYIEESGTFHDVTPIRFVDITDNPITTGGPGEFVHTYQTSAPHNAAPGDYVTIKNVLADVDGLATEVYTDPFVTGPSGDTNVRVVTPTPHFAKRGDTVVFSGASTFDGIDAADLNISHQVLDVVSPTEYIINTLSSATAGYTVGGGAVTAVYLARINREYEVLDTPTTTSFTFRTDTPAVTGGVNGGGTGVRAEFQVSIGFSFNITGGGWGAGTWSRNTWSSPVDSSVSAISLRIWSADNFGEDLVFCTRDGPLYVWQAQNGLNTRGVKLADLPGANQVPEQTSIVRVSDARHVLAIGTTNIGTTVFDPLLVRWSSQENYLDWGPRRDNTAGDLRIPMGSFVVAALKSRQETLVWTDHSLHSVQYVGPPFIFGIQTVAENTNIVGPNAAVNVDNVTYWMGKDRFWVYSGRVQALKCSVQRYIFSRLNTAQLSQVYAAANDKFTEVTWFYPSEGSSENDSYVTYNYQDDVWTYGSMSRTAWVNCPGRGNFPYAAFGGLNDDGQLLVHETGYEDGTVNPPAPIVSYIESADFDIADGDKLMFLYRILPDISFSRSTSDSPSVDMIVTGKKFPGEAYLSTQVGQVTKTTTVDQYTKEFWLRMRARQARIRVVSYTGGTCWVLGALRFDLRVDGKK